VSTFFERLEGRCRQVDSLVCVGIDPQPDDLPASPGSEPDALLEFSRRLIDATASYAAAFKPNAAFFEAYGPAGAHVLKKVIEYAPKEIPVILDAKRGDIASTARAYARAVFQAYGAGAVTANPYLGRDAIEPFLEAAGHAVFLLCKTSNPGSGDLQDLFTFSARSGRGGYLYERVAQLGVELNRAGNLGLVAGATHPAELARIRAIAPDLWILAPGIGAQGGEILETLKAGLRQDGLGLLINASRSISRTPDPGAAADQLRQAINQARSSLQQQSSTGVNVISLQPNLAALADGLLEAGCVKFGSFTLKSGLQSPIYLDLRRLASFPHLLAQASLAYLDLLEPLAFDRLAALPYAALPIGAAVSLFSGKPLVYPRKEVKTYGTRAEVEGEYQPGETVVVIDDLTTTGGSKFEAIEKLTQAGLAVRDVIVLIDRQSGAGEALQQAGFRLHAVMNLTAMLEYWRQKGSITEAQLAETLAFLDRTRD
jgi:uridine monophosphate synthetase